MIPLYILGMLFRYGPRHGYQIKKMIGEQLADFTEIKLPTIYYHLEKMETAGYITAEAVKDGERPERRVYQISDSGRGHFQSLLYNALEFNYRPTFEADSVLFFSECVERESVAAALYKYREKLSSSLEHIEEHRSQVIPYLPQEMQGAAALIFEHHLMHMQTELAWSDKALALYGM